MSPWIAFLIGLLAGLVVGFVVGGLVGRARSVPDEAADPTAARFKDWKG